MTALKMNFENIKNILKKTFQEKLTQKSKLYISISLGWIIFIGYLTWWNGVKSLSLDKSFRWDEWFWFGVIPATIPYVFYYIWKKPLTEEEKSKEE
jgi:intracellular septation protein A